MAFINSLRNQLLPLLIGITFFGIYGGNAIGLFGLGILILYAALKYLLPAEREHNVQQIKIHGKRSFAILTLLFFASLFVSAVMGINPEKSLHTATLMLLLGLGCAILFFSLLNIDKETFLKIPRFIFIIGTIIAVLIMGELLLWKTIGMDFHDNKIVNLSRRYATIFGLMMPFMLTYLFQKEQKRLWLGAFIFMTAVIISGGRSGIVCAASSILLFIAFTQWPRLKKWKETFLCFSASLLASIIAGTYGYYLIAGAEKLGYRISGYDAVTGSGRTEIWQFILEKVPQHPIWGIGPRTFRYLDFSGVHLRSYVHPHNMTLELLLETGIVGLTLACILAVITLCKSWSVIFTKNIYTTDGWRSIAIATLISLISYVIVAQFMTSIFHGWWVMYLFLLLVLLGVSCIKLRDEEKATAKLYNADRTKQYPVAVSVIMPCHNGAAYLGDAVNSVLAQTYTNWELLIVDDGSTDNSYTLMKNLAQSDPRIKIFRNKEATGEGAARNLLLENASGRYMALLDCDDRWLPNKLEIQIGRMEQKSCPLTYGAYTLINEDGNVIGKMVPDRKKLTISDMFSTNDIGCPTAVFDRAYFGDRRMPNLKRNTDMVFWIELLKSAYAAQCINTVLSEYRVHKKSVSYNKISMAKAHWNTYCHDLNTPLPFAILYFIRYALRGLKKTLLARHKA